MIKGTEKRENTGKFKETVDAITNGISQLFLGTSNRVPKTSNNLLPETPAQRTFFTSLPQDVLNMIFSYAAPGKTFLPQTLLVNKHLNRATNTFLQSKFNPTSEYAADQQAEIDYLFQHEAEILKLTSFAVGLGPGLKFKNLRIKKCFKRLRESSTSPLFFHRREQILNRLNAAIILNKIAEILAAPMQGMYGQITNTQLTVLDCSNCFLTRFPSSILEKKGKLRHPLLRNLTEIHLRGNKLKALPEVLRLFEKLSVLSLENNCFSEVPAVLTKLPALKALLLNNNFLTSIEPALVSKLRQYVNNGQLQVISLQDTLNAQKTKQTLPTNTLKL